MGLPTTSFCSSAAIAAVNPYWPPSFLRTTQILALLNCGHTSFKITAEVTLIRYCLPELPMSICAIQVLLLVCIALEPKHPCLAANLRIGIYNGKMFLSDYSATVDPPLNFNSNEMVKWWKISPLASTFCITRIAEVGQFWPILAYFGPNVLRFFLGHFFPLGASASHFRGSISNARGTFQPKTHASSHSFTSSCWPRFNIGCISDVVFICIWVILIYIYKKAKKRIIKSRFTQIFE